MQQSSRDTIAAIATPTGHGGVGIVRVSGDAVADIARSVLGQLPPPRYALHRVFKDAHERAIDDGIALYFPAPHSFTGEDVLELQGHGGPVVMDMLLKRVCALGARPARPGEFSERAFLNEKLDLAQAEAIADLIDSHSEQAARSAVRSLQGEFSKQIETLSNDIIELRAYIEAALDFPDEEIDFLADDKIGIKLQSLQTRLAGIQQTARQGSLLREGAVLVIIGAPNVGKSTLLNRLAGRETAIVTDIPGTTRDVLVENIQLDGLPLRVIDTAGLRETTDPIELEGIRRARDELHKADMVLWLEDVIAETGADNHFIEKNPPVIQKELPADIPRIKVWNKIDLRKHSPGYRNDEVYISAKTGEGIAGLVALLKTTLGYRTDTEEGVFMARRRHLAALEAAGLSLEQAAGLLRTGCAGELVAEELRTAHNGLAQITGGFTTEDLLGEIFSSFCIGK